MKNFLFGATNVLKNSDKEKYLYGRYWIAFDSRGSRSFEDDFAKILIIIGVDDSSPSHCDNGKNNFLILGNGPTFCINGSFESQEKRVWY